MINSYFILLADCKLVKGYNRSMIYDLTRKTFSIIPNTLHEILIHDYELNIMQIIEKYGQEYEGIILEYFKFLLEKEYIFLTENQEEIQRFSKVNSNWESPYFVTNVIIDFNTIMHPMQSIIEQLEELGSVHLELRFYSEKLLENLDSILEKTLKSRVKSINLIMPYYSSLQLGSILKKHRRIVSVVFYAASTNSSQEINNVLVHNIKSVIQNHKCCGSITMNNFTINRSFYYETLNFNNCLNKKVSITADGDIKNCPSMNRSFGNIEVNSIKNIIKNVDFQKVWGIRKSDIDICKVCEYRNMCLDCRAFVENPKNEFSKPLKCGYDPYTNKWDKWSTNPLKQLAIHHYRLNEVC